jgi:anti-sigma regulatory factor (Ser/Thr protein kinase)
MEVSSGASVVLRPRAEMVAVARRFIASTLASWDRSIDPAVAVLLTDELVTNAIVHAQTHVTLVLRFKTPVVRVEVNDESAGPAHVANPGAEAEGGRGLRLVDRFADRWGVQPTAGGGKAVWFELTPAKRA